MLTLSFIKYAICSFTLLATTCNGLPSNNVEEKILPQSEEINEITDRIVKIKKDKNKSFLTWITDPLITNPILSCAAVGYCYVKLQEKNRDDFQDFVVASTGSFGIGLFAYWIYQIAQELKLIESASARDPSGNIEIDTISQQPNLYSSSLFPILSTLFLIYGYLGLTGNNRDFIEKIIAIITTSSGVGLFALWTEQVAQKLKPLKSLALIPTLGTAALCHGYCILQKRDLDTSGRLIAEMEISFGLASYVYWMYQIAKKLDLIESCPESTKDSEENIRRWNQALWGNLSTIIFHI